MTKPAYPLGGPYGELVLTVNGVVGTLYLQDEQNGTKTLQLHQTDGTLTALGLLSTAAENEAATKANYAAATDTDTAAHLATTVNAIATAHNSLLAKLKTAGLVTAD